MPIQNHISCIFCLLTMSCFAYLGANKINTRISEILRNIENSPVVYSVPEEFLIEEIPFNITCNPIVNDLCYLILEGSNSTKWNVCVERHYYLLNYNNGSVVHMRNVYVSDTGAISTGKNEIYIKPTGHAAGPSFIYKFYPGKVIAYHRKVILVGHLGMDSYGHFINDLLCPLLIVPEAAFKDSVIICRTNPFIHEYIKYVGFNNDIILLHQSDWIYCSEVYYPGYPRPHNSHLGNIYLKLGQIIRKSLGLENVIPDRYVLSNRITIWRQIHNMDEVLLKTKEKYPEYNWEIHNMTPKPLPELAKIWGHARILFAVAGSNLMNAFLFAQGSVVIHLLGDVNDLTAIDCCLASQAKTILMMDGKIPHVGAVKNYLNISQFHIALKSAIYYMKHKKWPNDNKGIELKYYEGAK